MSDSRSVDRALVFQSSDHGLIPGLTTLAKGNRNEIKEKRRREKRGRKKVIAKNREVKDQMRRRKENNRKKEKVKRRMRAENKAEGI